MEIKTPLNSDDLHRMMYSLMPDTEDHLTLWNKHRSSKLYITREFGEDGIPYFVLEFSETPGLYITFDSMIKCHVPEGVEFTTDNRICGRLFCWSFKVLEHVIHGQDVTPEDCE